MLTKPSHCINAIWNIWTGDNMCLGTRNKKSTIEKPHLSIQNPQQTFYYNSPRKYTFSSAHTHTCAYQQNLQSIQTDIPCSNSRTCEINKIMWYVCTVHTKQHALCMLIMMRISFGEISLQANCGIATTLTAHNRNIQKCINLRKTWGMIDANVETCIYRYLHRIHNVHMIHSFTNIEINRN